MKKKLKASQKFKLKDVHGHHNHDEFAQTDYEELVDIMFKEGSEPVSDDASSHFSHHINNDEEEENLCHRLHHKLHESFHTIRIKLGLKAVILK